MARTVGWTETALADLDATAAFIARDSAYYARVVVREAFNASGKLDMFAERGRIVPEVADPAIRELFLRGTYRLIYQVTENRVHILGFIHGARNLRALWKRERRGHVAGPHDK